MAKRSRVRAPESATTESGENESSQLMHATWVLLPKARPNGVGVLVLSLNRFEEELQRSNGIEGREIRGDGSKDVDVQGIKSIEKES